MVTIPEIFNTVMSPCYLLDEQKFEDNLRILQEAGNKAGIEVIISFKAFAVWKVFNILQEYNTGFSGSSLHEVLLGNEYLNQLSHTYCPVYLEDEFEKINQMSSHLTFNSFGQFNKFKNKLTQDTSYGFRINPGYSEVETALYNPCSPGSRLGIHREELPDQLPERIKGFHFHNLCESNSHALEKTLDAVEEKYANYFAQLEWINIGGGHLLTHKDYDSKHFIQVISNFRKKYPHLKIIMEPGAAFVWESGYLVSEVQDIVESGGIKTAILNVSFTAHMPDCLEMPYKPNVLGTSVLNSERHKYRLGGISCLAGDFVGDYGFDQPISPGDKIVFLDMMHYTIVKSTMFNGVKHPSIGIIHESKVEIIREFNYADYKNRMA